MILARTAFWDEESLSGCAGHPQRPTGVSTCRSFGQLLTKALPSDVHPSLTSPSQPAKSNKSSAANELQELTPLASLQMEKARIHGALVSYLSCGWQESIDGQPSMMQTRSGSSTSTMTQLSVSSDGRDMCGYNEKASAQQQQHMSMSMLREALDASPEKQKPSSVTERHISRRAEAMAALEGRKPGMPHG